ncbi:hypothetical protein C1752_14376 [Acaryochloris thomasi RCC1774]|uniref:Uncharacterized protein n=1 Tax=Acaryochloris thomasi RCC1774 TaxID=1764569 RepID=A0A2W1J6V9_9CYAN|nr:hypothetical protein [Acaryochloris thomasi]PZD70289.1 hypothetical protein C1752_14376 [Acaryochloris thomasi RCC1774]
MSKTFTRSELRNIARYHKLLLWSILAAIAANLARLTLEGEAIFWASIAVQPSFKS